MSTHEMPQVGHKVVGVIKGVKGHCSAGHTVGQTIALSGHDTGGICGFFYHQIFPYIIMLQFGGGFPPEWGDPNVIELDCMDKHNLVTIELRRVVE
ncbi:MAG: TIGR04076 family protein [Desulfomonilaceae bacterium]